MPEARKGNYFRWSLLLLLVLLLVAPALAALSGLFGQAGEHWPLLRSTLLPVYIKNTLVIAAGVIVLSLILGIVPAVLLHRYSIPGSGLLPLLLVLPLAIPAYINGMAYHALLDYASPLYVFLRQNFGFQSGPYLLFNLHSNLGVILVFSLSYYPYVFLLTRASLKAFNPSYDEAARLLGAGQSRVFLRLLLPHLRPAIVASLALVLMEVLNDYGLVRFFGVETFTTGIFNAWFVLRDSTAAFRLAGLLLLFAFLLLFAEQWQRPQISSRQRLTHRPHRKLNISGLFAVAVLLISAFPFVFGFALPAMQLVAMSVKAWPLITRPDFGGLMTNSLILALGAGALATILALLLLTLSRRLQSRISGFLVLFATAGYALPGAVIAIGMLMLVNTMAFNPVMSAFAGWLLTATIAVLMYAYVARFITASWNSVESGAGALGRSQLEAARLSRAPSWLVFRDIVWPALRPSVFAGFVMVSMDVLKELPLTLLLRPFNFDTLAIRAFEYAADERLAEASPYALLIVAAGFLPVWIMRKNKMI